MRRLQFQMLQTYHLNNNLTQGGAEGSKAGGEEARNSKPTTAARRCPTRKNSDIE